MVQKGSYLKHVYLFNHQKENLSRLKLHTSNVNFQPPSANLPLMATDVKAWSGGHCHWRFSRPGQRHCFGVGLCRRNWNRKGELESLLFAVVFVVVRLFLLLLLLFSLLFLLFLLLFLFFLLFLLLLFLLFSFLLFLFFSCLCVCFSSFSRSCSCSCFFFFVLVIPVVLVVLVLGLIHALVPVLFLVLAAVVLLVLILVILLRSSGCCCVVVGCRSARKVGIPMVH